MKTFRDKSRILTDVTCKQYPFNMIYFVKHII